MNVRYIDINEVPALGIIRSRLAAVAPGFDISEVGYDGDRYQYRLRLASGNKEVIASVRRDLVDDLRDNPSTSDSTYSQYLIAKLDQALTADL